MVHQVTDQIASISVAEMPAETVQHLLTVAAKLYYMCREAGRDFGPFVHDEALSATEVMVVVTNMLHAAEIEVFELAMWTMRGNHEGREASDD